MPHETMKNSMRMRLILIPSGILLLGIVAAIVVALGDARARIASEIDSGANLGGRLISYALDDLAASKDPVAAWRRLREGLSHVRHIVVVYRGQAPELEREPADPSRLDPEAAPRSAAPDWFLRLFEPASAEKIFPVSIGGRPSGELVMSGEPADEAAEIWRSLVFLTGLLTAISAAIIGLLLLTARHTLKPIDDLAAGLDRLGRGQFDALGEIRISELRRIGEHFNRLARTLAQAEAENHRLIDRLLSIQDAERAEIARELHDEFGASLFGVRAAASCIVAAASGAFAANAAAKAEIIDRAGTISALADAIQKQNYRILDRIRPVILHQMGLAEALRHLVSSWRARHREFACDIVVPAENPKGVPALSQEISLTSYRIVQECLTNVVRHSKAKGVRVAMEFCSGASLRLSIEDDGVGLPREFKFGFGFLGMSERVRKLGGSLKIGGGARAGTRIEALIPLERVPIGWNHPIDKNSLQTSKLEHVLIEKVDQLFRNML